MRSFKEFLTLQLEYSEKIIQQLIDRWEEDETIVRDYIKKFDRYKQSPSIVKKDLFQYKTFRDLETVVDAAETKSLRKKKQKGKVAPAPEVSKENLATPLVDDENVTIYLADDEHKCIQHGKGYNFCIARPAGGNMYNSYRVTDSSTFHYVFFKNIPKSDDYHIMVLDATKDGYKATFANNDTKTVEWEDIVSIYNKYNIDFNQYKEVFKNIELSDIDKRNLQKLQMFRRMRNDGGKEREWESASEEARLIILQSGTRIPFSIWKTLDKFQRNEHVSVGANLSTHIVKDLSFAERRRYIKVRETTIPQLIEHDSYSFNILDSETQYGKDKAEEEYEELKATLKGGVPMRNDDYNIPDLIFEDGILEIHWRNFLNKLPEELKTIDIDHISIWDTPNLKTINNLPDKLRALSVTRIGAETIELPKYVSNFTSSHATQLKTVSWDGHSMGKLEIESSPKLTNLFNLSKVTYDIRLCDVGVKSLEFDGVIQFENFTLINAPNIKKLNLRYKDSWHVYVFIENCRELEDIILPYNISDAYMLYDLPNLKDIVLPNYTTRNVKIRNVPSLKASKVKFDSSDLGRYHLETDNTELYEKWRKYRKDNKTESDDDDVPF